MNLLKQFYWKVRTGWRRQVLTRFRSSFSQYEQDRWVIREMFRGKRDGFFLEIGSNDGFTFNNTFLLEARYGWKGICIEANPRLQHRLRANRTARIVTDCVDRDFGTVEFALRGYIGGIVAADTDNPTADGCEVVRLSARPLLYILEKERAPTVIDYFSLDAEGAEERILDRFDFSRYTFSTMTIERPTPRLQGILAQNGYVLVKHIPGVDNFYMHRSFLAEFMRTHLDIEPWIQTNYQSALDKTGHQWQTP